MTSSGILINEVSGGLITRKISDLPHDFSRLEEECKSEGFNFLEKMRVEWLSGKNRFNQKGEVLYAIFDREKLVAIGGINFDPYVKESGVGRIRHLYVSREYRKLGLGSTLLKQLIGAGSRNFQKLRLRTDTVTAACFYENIGFKPVESESASHEWDFRA